MSRIEMTQSGPVLRVETAEVARQWQQRTYDKVSSILYDSQYMSLEDAEAHLEECRRTGDINVFLQQYGEAYELITHIMSDYTIDALISQLESIKSKRSELSHVITQMERKRVEFEVNRVNPWLV